MMPAAALAPEIAAYMRQIAAGEDEQPPVRDLPRRVLSTHNHWLTEAEAAHDTVSFSTFQSLPEYQHYLQEEDKFVRLLAFLFRNGDVYYLSEEPGVPEVCPAESLQRVLSLATAGLREQRPCVLYSGRFQVILLSAFDLNMAAYFLDPQHVPSFAERARVYDLHLL
jgi:hypothetical protein